jgi:hypothetical protein
MVKKKRRSSSRKLKRERRTYSRFSPFAIGHSLGLVGVLVMLLYSIMAWFSSFNETLIASQFPLRFSFFDWTIIIGLIQIYVLCYIGGWIFAKGYNQTIREGGV